MSNKPYEKMSAQELQEEPWRGLSPEDLEKFEAVAKELAQTSHNAQWLLDKIHAHKGELRQRELAA